ncbi:C39 family peptidase [Nocardioides mangrovi]|uniref:C39 family peptidase n=1 Tax=Nocardioides mangrovi TaxID=2874580 RepID=A0ABS7UA60_9ACTN|nr:C39 family peptidase [Nocardioides mangrovi]MBZ5737875.1 C39 family peptidase [Nocardioides mangrovi]
MSRPRPRTIAIGALIVLLAVAPFVPRGSHHDDGSILPSGDGNGSDSALRPAMTAGTSRITPAMQREIDQVVAQGQRVGRLGKASANQLVDDAVRCADLDGQRYCLGFGWTQDTQAQVQARMARAARTAAKMPARINTGDLGPAASLARYARMSPADRAAADRAELEDAARSVAKVWLLRHEIQGEALPADFLADHPEARAATATTPADLSTDAPATAARTKATSKPSATPTATATPTTKTTKKPTATPTATATPTSTTSAAATKKASDYPRRSVIMNPQHVSEQHMTYWCGPTSMQMIAWGWAGKARSQQHWADKLGTTTGGTAITSMVRVTNRYTGWDNPARAGRYITLDIGSWSYQKWWLLMMRHIHDYRAPVILHPILLKKFYPYLDDDASGHFQVGRGYDKRGKKPDQLGYFEPWNQQRFDPSEPYISRVQWRAAYKSYRANQAHFQHNVGV